MFGGIRLYSQGFIAVLMALYSLPIAAQTDIRPEPGGKRLLSVDGNDIRNAPDGKRLLFIDENSIRPEPGGKRLLFIDGESVRAEPGGIRLVFIDGKAIRRKPGGKVLLHVSHPDVRPSADGERLLFIDGKELTRSQLVAVLYYQMPDIFRLSKAEEAELKKAMAEAAAESDEKPTPTKKRQTDSEGDLEKPSDPLSGTYSIAEFSSSDHQKQAGKVLVEKKGEHFTLSFQFQSGSEWQGTAIQKGKELWVAMGPVNTVGLAVYDIKEGELSGVWVPYYAPGEDDSNLGSEHLHGPKNLGGNYHITAGQAPKTGAPYKGTVNIAHQKVELEDKVGTYLLTWTLGKIKIHGCGLHVGNSLVVSSGSGKDFAIARFKIDKDNLAGDFFTSHKSNGKFKLVKEADAEEKSDQEEKKEE